MPTANNVTRLLDANGITYTAFELPQEKLGALETASLLGVSPARVFKTIVVKAEAAHRTILALVPGDAVVDLKKVAASIGEKKVQLATEKEAEALTGLQAGGISPLALINRGFRVLIDASALDHTEIHVSGGRRGFNIRLPVTALVELAKARLVPICKPNLEADRGAAGEPIP
jgi:Cys-tRNA(Pro)/Cys-tRNA(Cys) deacylase